MISSTTKAKTAGTRIRHGLFLFAISMMLGACMMATLSWGGSSRQITFVISGAVEHRVPARASTTPGSRLLLPTATSLTVTLVAVAGTADPQMATKALDSTSVTATVVFNNLSTGTYQVTASAKDAAGTEILRQSAQVYFSPSTSSTILNLVPVSGLGLSPLTSAQATAGTLVAGTASTWTVPQAAVITGTGASIALTTGDPSLRLFAQYADGRLINADSTLRYVAVSDAGTSPADAFITLYNPGATDQPYRFILNPVSLAFDGNASTGGAPPATQYGVQSDTLTLPSVGTLAKTGYSFVNWNTAANGSGTAHAAGGSIALGVATGTVTLYATWNLDTFAVTFDSQGGSAVAGASVAPGATLTQPADPTLAGSTFGGWFKEAACTNAWTFTTDTVTAATTLYAKWTASVVAVTFDSQGGSAVTAQSVASGSTATLPTAPTRTDYVFGGWYKEAASTNAWTFATDTVTAATTLYAKWTLSGVVTLSVANPSVAFTKNAAGKMLGVGSAGTLDEGHVSGAVVIFNGVSFEMWYSGQDGGTSGTSGTALSAVGHATSADGIAWTKTRTTTMTGLEPGTTGAFDDGGMDVGSVIREGTVLKMWYSGAAKGGGGIVKGVGYAESLDDGATWTKAPSNPILTVAAGTWEDQVGTKVIGYPTVLKIGATYYMYYVAGAGTTVDMGLATSPDGIAWAKDAANPVFSRTTPTRSDTLDSNGLMGGSVLFDGSTWHMWYTGVGSDGKYRPEYVSSSDGKAWTLGATRPVLLPGAPSAWDEMMVLGGSPIIVNGKIWLYYSGMGTGSSGPDGIGLAQILN